MSHSKGKNPKRRKNNKKKNNRRKPSGGKGFTPEFIKNQNVVFGGRYSGVVEINPKGFGFIRKLDYEFTSNEKDPFLTPDEVRHYNLRPGLEVEGEFEVDQRNNKHVKSVEKINNKPAALWARVPRFEHQTPIMPDELIKLTESPEDIEMRVMDLIAPIGKGQRALIVAPPRTGKTVLLKKIAKSVDELHRDIHLAILLVDERPEEVTDFLRTTKGRVFASSNDKPISSHIRIS
ncbi:MAG TPA: hypothetical protein VKA34_11685, partial [Balneolales bacterium]|nr:hypothetical protein [Balneolales bacterium]